MVVPGAAISKRTVIGTSVAGSLLQAILFGVHAWIRNVARGTPPRFGVDTLLGAATGVASTAVAVAPFLVAVLLVSIDAAPRRVATGSALVYGWNLLVTAAIVSLGATSVRFGLPVLAVPLSRVVAFLAIATVVWTAYHGGFERLAAATGGADHHPLFALAADEPIGPGLSVQRGLAAAGAGALVGSLGLGRITYIGRVTERITHCLCTPCQYS